MVVFFMAEPPTKRHKGSVMRVDMPLRTSAFARDESELSPLDRMIIEMLARRPVRRIASRRALSA